MSTFLTVAAIWCLPTVLFVVWVYADRAADRLLDWWCDRHALNSADGEWLDAFGVRR